MSDPHVSIIMPAHNVAAFAGEAIASIAAQTAGGFEMIVVDDGSTDATAEILRRAQAAWPREDAPLGLVYQDNAGAAAARNRGVAEARGALVGFIDADDRWSPETLGHLVGALDAFADSDIACPRYRRIDEAGVEVNYLGEPVQKAQPPGGETMPPRRFDAVETLIEMPAQSATGVLVRRAALVAGGGFDADLKSNNDVDCWLRILWTRQSSLVQCPAALVDYRMRSAQITSDVRRMQDGHARFLRNHQPLLQAMGRRARRHHFGLVRAYWALLAARQGDLGTAFGHWLRALVYAPRLALPGTLGSSALFAMAKSILPRTLWHGLSAARRRLRS
ncbi:glycosyltransferase family 2 protein [uncultured Roseobacter sp.]|uniref:glycosyltransferase family 2 protein n=1 Tax=uncultured Roseobacter sp. TaxID=114847 RepID=UPI00262DF299|nr:glycosyltransferase family 2 protein [uncultured Roseobacter sp.]